MDDSLARIRRVYDRDPEREWARLTRGAQNQLEYLVTTFTLERYLPPPTELGPILDAGGGPGRYTILLAQRGYRLTLFDLSPGLLDLGKRRIQEAGEGVERHVDAVIEGSFTDLSAFPDSKFSAVLCLGGAFSHASTASERRQAMFELCRVLKPDGLLFLNALNYIGALRAVAQWWPDERTIEIFHELYAGQTTDIVDGAPAYFFYPEEFVELLTGAGLTVVALYGAEGIGSHLQEEHLLALIEDRNVWPKWRDVLLKTADHPSVIGCSRSLLAVARRSP